MNGVSPWRAPSEPDEWFAAARDLLDHFLRSVGRYGIWASPDLKMLRSDSAFPTYEHSTRTIRIGMPDPQTLAGRIYWLFIARLTGAPDMAAAVERAGAQLPFLVAHEATHHLRHQYGAPTDNDFIEEQVANTVALAYIREYETYRDVTRQVAATAAEADTSLDALADGVSRYVGGFRISLTDILIERSGLPADELARVEAFAKAIRRPVDEVLDQTLFADPQRRQQAEDLQRRSQRYFNANYLVDFATYAQFFCGWFKWYGNSRSEPALGEVLRAHVLTDDWELTRRQETAWFVEALLDHPADELAASAAELLAGDPNRTVDVIHLLNSPRDAVRLAALRGLPTCAGADAQLAPSLVALMQGMHRDEMVAAAALTLAGTQTAVINPHQLRLAIATLGEALGRPGNDRLDALREMSLRRIDAAQLPELAGLVMAALRAEQPAERSAATLLLAHATPTVGWVAEISPLLEDGDPIVRRDSLRACDRHAAGRELRPLLLAALMDDSVGVRDVAEQLLCARAAPDQATRQAVADPRLDWDARLRLCRVAAATQSLEDAEQSALVVLRQPGHWQDRLANLSRTMTGVDGVETLVRQAVVEEQSRLRVLAAQVVCAVAASPALDLVVEGLQSSDRSIRRTAVEMARNAGVVKALQAPLQGILDEPVSTDGRAQAGRRRVANEPGRQRLAVALADYPDLFLRSLVRGEPESRSEPEAMLTVTEILVFLHSADMFATSPIRQLHGLAESAIVRRCASGEPVFAAGDKPEATYVIASGTVRVTGPGGGEGRLYAPRESIGELELLSGRCYSSDAVAAEDCTLIRLAGEQLFNYAIADPTVLLQWTQQLSARLLDAPTAGGVGPAQGPNPMARERGLSYIWQVPRDLQGQKGAAASPDSDAP